MMCIEFYQAIVGVCVVYLCAGAGYMRYGGLNNFAFRLSIKGVNDYTMAGAGSVITRKRIAKLASR